MLFPAIIFRRSAVDKKIATRIEQAPMRGIGLKAEADDIRENHLLQFHEMETREGKLLGARAICTLKGCLVIFAVDYCILRL